MTTITKPDLVLRVAVAGQRELPEAARDGLVRRLDAVYGVLGETVEALAPGAGEDPQAVGISAYYAPAAPMLRLLTGLADGADQLAATTFVADRRGRVRRALAAVLPFDAFTYRDRSPVEDKQGFDTLLADCEHVIELDGRYLPDPPPGAPPDDFPKRCRARAYRAQAAVLLRQCDLLIAIADPAHQGRAGGTRETMERALALDIPVLFLPLSTDAVTLIGSRGALEPEPDLALRTPTPDWQEALRACVTDLVATPALGTDKDAGPLREFERAFLDEFFSEVEHRPGLRRRLWEWFARRFKDAGKAPPGSDPPLDAFRAFRARATEMNYL